MGKLDVHGMAAQTLQRDMDSLLYFFGELGLGKEGQSLLRRLFMKSEWLMATRRMEIAKRLLKGQNFEQIRLELGVGRSTIEHVDRWLDDELGSAREAIRRKQNEHPAHEVPFSPRWLAKTFPEHFPLLRAVLGLDRRK